MCHQYHVTPVYKGLSTEVHMQKEKSELSTAETVYKNVPPLHPPPHKGIDVGQNLLTVPR